MDNHLARLGEYADLFYSYFPSTRQEEDLIVLRGHQITETLLFLYLRKHVNNPDCLDGFRVRWDSLIALVKSLRAWNEPHDEWVWSSAIRLERARNQFAHYIEPEKADKLVADFINCVRSNYRQFNEVPGPDDLKKAIFILYFKLCSLLALDEFPPCTATTHVRDEIAKECTAMINEGIQPNEPAD